jgi:hypothetical protein
MRTCNVAERGSEYPRIFFSGSGFQVRGDIYFIAQILGRIEPSHAKSARCVRVNLRTHLAFLAFSLEQLM